MVQARLREARVARLATVDADGRPHLVPVCFAYDGRAFYTALDLKPKRTAPARLARLRHIQARPHVALLIDDYQEDWKRLWYILVRGTAVVVPVSDRAKRTAARRLLKGKYAPYAAGLLPEDAPLIEIVPRKILSWASAESP